jgi:hypothetical protein
LTTGLGAHWAALCPLGALNTARARYLSNMCRFSAMWIPFALEIDFRCFFDLGELSTLRARST